MANTKNRGYYRRFKTGAKIGKLELIRRIDDAGTGNSTSRKWLCKCECGREVEIWQTAFCRGEETLACRICKGKSLPKRGRAACRHIRYVWREFIRGNCIPQWENRLLFAEAVEEQHFGLWPTRVDEAEPLGPDNIEWREPVYDPMNRKNREELVAVLVKRGHSEDEARERAYSLTKTRVYQLLHQDRGECLICGKPRRISKRYCDKCRPKYMAYRLKYQQQMYAEFRAWRKSKAGRLASRRIKQGLNFNGHKK